jgi:hypothetical protein
LGYELIECDKVKWLLHSLIFTVVTTIALWHAYFSVFNLCLEFTLQIFVPVHQHVHWCLAIINMKAKTLQYLDSLGGNDPRVPEMLVSLSDLARKTIQLEMHSTFSILYMFFFTWRPRIVVKLLELFLSKRTF